MIAFGSAEMSAGDWPHRGWEYRIAGVEAVEDPELSSEMPRRAAFQFVDATANASPVLQQPRQLHVTGTTLLIRERTQHWASAESSS
jgi:hypothetical protein